MWVKLRSFVGVFSLGSFKRTASGKVFELWNLQELLRRHLLQATSVDCANLILKHHLDRLGFQDLLFALWMCAIVQQRSKNLCLVSAAPPVGETWACMDLRTYSTGLAKQPAPPLLKMLDWSSGLFITKGRRMI